MSEQPDVIQVKIGDNPAPRLDKALADAVPDNSGLSRSRLQALIGEGAVTREDGTTLLDARTKIEPGAVLLINMPAAVPLETKAENIPLDVVFEDEHLIVVNKPVGMVVHPAAGALTGTLVNALLYHCGDSLSGIGGTVRPGIVHRIDRETSGLLVVAKSDLAHHGLAKQFAAHDLERRYLAVVKGAPERSDPRLAGLKGVSWESGGILRIEGNIGRHPGDRKRMAVLASRGKHAVTRARVLERFGGDRPLASLVECRLETGRTHQIRVHMTFAGHSLVGDRVYGRVGGPDFMRDFPRQALHAETLGFVHPFTAVNLRFQADFPDDMRALIEDLRAL
ncbi:RluA family pseudouridine synthase [Amaricoccus tamworthensis]|uniref:RluA family pseudouridine synthase n=1 Tax=Amaricoccus tamworthensis TaxID=57002 RepID=UPI003C7CC219